jgi:UV DNA damage endonuclease
LPGKVRWGLCCQFVDAPIKFRTATHRYCVSLSGRDRADYLSAIVAANAASLTNAIATCAELGIGAFRVTSQLLPLATHPVSGYSLLDLPEGTAIAQAFGQARELARTCDIRLSLHPDQFVVLNSERADVVASSVREMEHQAAVAGLIGAEALTLHAGSGAGGIAASLDRLEKGIDRLSSSARGLLALENDDRSFSPAELLPLCEKTGIPFIYDVHHHRCLPDRFSVAETSERAAATWGAREPWMHISSPRDGWGSANRRPHAEFINPADVPPEWMGKRVTIDVEAKMKERAVIAIRATMQEQLAQ